MIEQHRCLHWKRAARGRLVRQRIRHPLLYGHGAEFGGGRRKSTRGPQSSGLQIIVWLGANIMADPAACVSPGGK